MYRSRGNISKPYQPMPHFIPCLYRCTRTPRPCPVDLNALMPSPSSSANPRLRQVLRTGALLVEREQAGEHVVVGKIGGPAICGNDGGIQLAVQIVEPGWALIVESGQGALLENGGGSFVNRQKPVGVIRHDLRLAAD